MGGKVHYDLYPSVRYRIHDANAIGSNNSVRARMLRLRWLIGGGVRRWTDMNVAALLPLLSEIMPENRRTLVDFVAARRENMLRRLMHISRSPIYRQTRLANLALRISFGLGKV
jgi:hypothetical protein